MTYREMVAHSLQMTEPETIEVDGEVITTNPVFPLGFAYFTTHLASIYAMSADMYTLHDFPTISVEGRESDDDGSPIEFPSVIEVVQILAQQGRSFMRQQAFFMQVQGFLGWLMNEDIPEAEEFGDPCWYDVEVLGDKWNEYVKVRQANER